MGKSKALKLNAYPDLFAIRLILLMQDAKILFSLTALKNQSAKEKIVTASIFEDKIESNILSQ